MGKKDNSSSALIYTDYEGRIRNTKNIQLLVPLHYKKAAIKTIPIKEKLPKP